VGDTKYDAHVLFYLVEIRFPLSLHHNSMKDIPIFTLTLPIFGVSFVFLANDTPTFSLE